MNKFLSLGNLLQSFFDKRLVSQQNVSQNTIDSYRDTWRLLLGYITKIKGCHVSDIPVETITADLVLDFFDFIEKERNCGVSTRNQRRAAIRAFARHVILTEPKYMAQFNRILMIPAKKAEKKILGYLTKPEMNAVLDSVDRSTVSGRRDYALLLFMYNTGARVSETASVRCGDLGQAQILIHGKGGKDRVVPLWTNTVKVLRGIIDEQTAQSKDAPLFRNARNLKITRSGIAYVLAEATRTASVECASLIARKISPHTLRHTTAMHLLQSGVDINLIRMWLGHVNLETTHGYIEADIEMKRAALQKGGITEGCPSYDWKPTDEVKAFLDSLGLK
jgi:site-specific recombinase XerD